MLSSLKSYWQYGTRYCAVEITTQDGSDLLFAVSAKKKKEEFTDINQIQANTFAELSEKLPKKQHCYLTINTDQVLIKQATINENIQKAVSEAFPGIDLSEFYYQVLQTKARSIVSIVKRNYVSEVIKDAEKHNIEILGFQIGFATVTNIIPLVNETVILTSRHSLEIEQNDIVSSESHRETVREYIIEDISIDSNHLLSLSGLFNYVNNSGYVGSNTESENKTLNTLHGERVFFRKGIGLGVGVLLLVVLINFLLFSSYRKTFVQIQEQVELSAAQKEIYANQLQRVEAKEKMVFNMLNSGNSKSSLYLNLVVDSKPSTILFNIITYQPLPRNIRPDKKIEIALNQIVIEGISGDKEAFSRWIQKLETLDWIARVTVLSYGQSNSNQDSFGINLEITDGSKK